MRPLIPGEILSLGHARAAARRAHDWAEADRIRGEIESAGYRVVDRGTDFAISPLHRADVVEGERVRHGWSGAVPTRLDEPPTTTATVLIVAGGDVGALARTLDGLRGHAPEGTQVVLVADRPDGILDQDDQGPELLARIAGPEPEVVWAGVPFSPAAARNAGLRRAAGEVVTWLTPGAVPTGDIVTPLVRALDDPAVAVSGAPGWTSGDLRRFREAGAGRVDTLEGGAVAFRRSDAARLGPLDEHFFGVEQLERWWSLVLRDGRDDEPTRDARALDLPLALAPREVPADDGADAARRRKRDFYRVIDRFGGRYDLLLAPAPRRAGRVAAD